MLAGFYELGASAADLELLGRIASLASLAGAPFIAGASSKLLGCPSLQTAPDPRDWGGVDPSLANSWRSLRQQTEAIYLGLTLPRLLLRLPYGKETDAIERFDFEEMTTTPRHESYLWGNPAWGCACLLAQAFTRNGWELQPGEVSEIEGLPLHIHREEDGQSHTQPCAEVLLTMTAAETILENGIMPFLSFKDRDIVRLARFQSIADPLTPLAGRWE
jgi:type VI secretion system protein ImpC